MSGPFLVCNGSLGVLNVARECAFWGEETQSSVTGYDRQVYVKFLSPAGKD